MNLRKFFRLKAPCANCPFLKAGGIELNPGRLEGIKAHLLRDDYSSFYCHKTTHHTGEEEDEDGGVTARPGRRRTAPALWRFCCPAAVITSLCAWHS